MKLVTQNINGIRSASKRGFWDFIEKELPDIVLIQEYRYNDVFPVPLNLSNYRWIINPAKKSGLWGTTVLYKEPLPIKLITKELGCCDEEGRFIHVRVDKLHILNVYFPHPGRRFENLEKKLSYCTALLNYVDRLDSPVIMGGDFNVAHTELDLENYERNREKPMFSKRERECFEKFLDLGFIDAYRRLNPNIRAYTWFPYGFNAFERNIGQRIDYILTKDVKIKDCYIKKLRVSDHSPVIYELRQKLLNLL